MRDALWLRRWIRYCYNSGILLSIRQKVFFSTRKYSSFRKCSSIRKCSICSTICENDSFATINSLSPNNRSGSWHTKHTKAMVSARVSPNLQVNL